MTADHSAAPPDEPDYSVYKCRDHWHVKPTVMTEDLSVSGDPFKTREAAQAVADRMNRGEDMTKRVIVSHTAPPDELGGAIAALEAVHNRWRDGEYATLAMANADLIAARLAVREVAGRMGAEGNGLSATERDAIDDGILALESEATQWFNRALNHVNPGDEENQHRAAESSDASADVLRALLTRFAHPTAPASGEEPQRGLGSINGDLTL